MMHISSCKTMTDFLSSPPLFSGVRVTRSLVLCVCCVDRCLSFCPFSFDHCDVWPSSIYEFWLPLWYLQALLINWKPGQTHEIKKTSTISIKVCNSEMSIAGQNQLQRIYTSYVCSHNLHAPPPLFPVLFQIMYYNFSELAISL